MKLNVTIEEMIKNGLTPNHVFVLFLLYNKDFDNCKKLFGIEESIKLRDDLLESPFILSTKSTKFTETVISRDKVGKLLGFKGDNINFWEFYNCYPVKIGTRVLRSAGPTTELAKKHEKKYLNKVKTKEHHEKAIKAITVFVSKQKIAGKLEFLPNIETVLNNSMWESWETLIEEGGSENSQWNSEEI
jgi:hypothetical protein